MKEKILVIDDEIEICKILEKFLTNRGYEVTVATSALVGLEKFKTERPKVILLDIRMPEMTGIEALREIRGIDKEVGVIMATAVNDEIIAREAMELGATDYIIKPFDLDYLEKSLIVKIVMMS